MGAGRKTRNANNDSSNPPYRRGSSSFRGLHKDELGGAIFMCKDNTMPECLSKQLFGLPPPHFSYVRNISPGLPIFLFNCTDKKLHGIYESASHGQLNIDAHAWTNGGAEKTAFPAQVRICIRSQCKPLIEKKFKKAIEHNYNAKPFWFELDHAQTQHLLFLFKPIPPSPLPVRSRASKINNCPPLSAVKRKLKNDLEVTSSANQYKVADNADTDFGGSRRELFNAFEGASSKEPILNYNDSKESISNGKEHFQGDLDGGSSAIVTNFIELNGRLDLQPVEGEHNNALLKLKFFSADSKLRSSSCVIGDSSSSSVLEDLYNKNEQLIDDSCTSTEKDDDLYDGNVASNDQHLDTFLEENRLMVSMNFCDGYKNMNSGKILNDSHSLYEQEEVSATPNLSHGNDKLLEAIRDLKVQTTTLAKQQVESDREILYLRDLIRNSGQKVLKLNARLKDLESKLGTSMLLDDGHKVEFVGQHIGSDDVIYLIGGSNGSALLSALDSFSPSLDILTPLKSMSSARSYVSSVALNGDIYALGGGDENSWYNIVEHYSQKHDEWTSCPPMIHEKGCLAGAALNGKIYAIGGGNRLEFFSDVEMFDPALGRWISWYSMFHKRYDLAAAELQGVLYAVGGSDGQRCLKSAERHDPREFSWTRIQDMKTRRKGHSMAVFDEKLHVIGGHDGDRMLSSVEVYDPRANAWMACEPMNSNRGLASAAVLGNSLFIIGGKDGENFVETVECYNGYGWYDSGLKAVGRRCGFSAVVL
ncbi:uncharacterized protein LOC110101179 [Dendrobium catenatum]|uniref:B2 protein n=1 Tax=Dendrobium catenatum TaxID=906689 RepID=A0A2I0VP64_9ASPA|nr:uncharacterized protein LOC110101179 [Dendrobium catenatum]XP_020684640.1 uncharacterized protein LOC110101179 [Dendrobium catenatum]XP_028556351.1 uncharacterized protein LOC110101179 [Dendrobium catenatum]PKU65207.1 B2 protein [Dendrobium catenatum]